MACIATTSTVLLIVMCAVSTIKICTALPIGADKVYTEEGKDVLLPCLLNVQVSNIQSLYWQRITNTTQGFETLYSFSKFVQLGWQSPVKGHISNDTDLVLLEVSLNQSGTYLCKILTHSETRIIEKEIHLSVIRPLRKIEIRAQGGNGTELIHNDNVIHLPSDKDIALACSIFGDVVPRASLSWVTSDGADVMDELNVTLMEYDGTDRMTAYINTSSIDGNGNVTCRAVQLVEGTPYVTLQATIQIKRIESDNGAVNHIITNCTVGERAHTEECCHLNMSMYPNTLRCGDTNINVTISPNLTLLHGIDKDLLERDTSPGYSLDEGSEPTNISWACSLEGYQGHLIKRSICAGLPTHGKQGKEYVVVPGRQADITNCTLEKRIQTKDCCHLNMSSYPHILICNNSSINVTIPTVNSTWFQAFNKDILEGGIDEGYSLYTSSEWANISWTCLLEGHDDSFNNRTICVDLHDSSNHSFVPEKYERSKNSILLEGLGGTFMSIVFIVIAIIIIIIIIRRKRKKGHRYENEIPVYIPVADALQTLMGNEGVAPGLPQRAPDEFGRRDRVPSLPSSTSGDLYECIPKMDIVPDIDPCDYFRHGPDASGVSKALMEAYKHSNIKPGDVKRKAAELDHKIAVVHQYNTGDETYSQCSSDSFDSE